MFDDFDTQIQCEELFPGEGLTAQLQWNDIEKGKDAAQALREYQKHTDVILVKADNLFRSCDMMMHSIEKTLDYHAEQNDLADLVLVLDGLAAEATDIEDECKADAVGLLFNKILVLDGQIHNRLMEVYYGRKDSSSKM